MHALPFALASLIAAALAPALLQALRETGHVRSNWRGRELPFPFGVLPVAAGLLALVPLVVLARVQHEALAEMVPHTVLIYALGVAMLGLVDDVLGGDGGGAVRGGGASSAPARGWRGHGGALLRGRLSTGVLKAAGSLGLALYVTSRLYASTGRWLLACGVLVLCTNVFNLLDLRPGRASKAFVLAGASLTLGSWDIRPLWTLGLFAGPAVVAGAYDLRERAMLGDTGANLLGGLAGLWLVIVLHTTGQLIALGMLALLTIYGELRSITLLVERTPGLRELDSWGRPSHQ